MGSTDAWRRARQLSRFPTRTAMKHSKRKRKNAPAATSVAQPVASVANAAGGAIQKTGANKIADLAPSKADYTLSANCTIQEGAALKSALLTLEDATRTV